MPSERIAAADHRVAVRESIGARERSLQDSNVRADGIRQEGRAPTARRVGIDNRWPSDGGSWEVRVQSEQQRRAGRVRHPTRDSRRLHQRRSLRAAVNQHVLRDPLHHRGRAFHHPVHHRHSLLLLPTRE